MSHGGEALAAGTEVGARFELRARLGVGRFGAVYRAYDRTRETEVALKHLREVSAASIRSLKREVEALADLRHPGLVAIDELVRLDGVWLLVMELLDGPSLSSWAGRDHARWREGAGQLGRALAALHRGGFVHRDLSPENVRVDATGRVVAIDLGLAAQRGSDDTALGRLHAVAPERLARRPVGAEADWYALGVLLYEGLAGAPPFRGRGAQILAQKRLRVPSLAVAAPELPPDLVALVDALLVPDPDERMARAAPHLERLGVATSSTLRAPFVGRDEELTVLGVALADAAERPRHVRVVGPSGAGKSALVEAFVEAQAPDAYTARAYAQHAFPFAGVDGLVRVLLARSTDETAEEHALLRAALGEGPHGLDGDGAEDAVVEALRRQLERAPSEGPLTLVLDDAQWMDRDAARLLGRALAMTRRPHLLVTVARVDEPRAPLADLDARVPPAARCVVGPLSLGALTSLASALGRVDAAVLAAASHGSPLLTLTLVRGSAGADLAQALSHRLTELPGGLEALLRLLAIAGRPTERELLFEAAAQLAIPDAFRALSGLLAERLVTLRHEGAHVIEVAHDAIARAAAGRAGDTERAACHAALDDAMELLGLVMPERQARHALGAGRRDRGCVLLERAADAARDAMAHERAAALSAEALALLDASADAPRRGRLEALRGAALAATGHHGEAAGALERAAGLVTDAGARLELRRARAEALLHAGNLAEGYAALEATLAHVGTTLPSPRAAVAELIASRARVGLFGVGLRERAAPIEVQRRIDASFSMGISLTNVDSFRGAALVWRSLIEAQRAGDRARFARSLAYVAAYTCNGGRRAAPFAERLIARAEALAIDPFSSAMVEGARSLLAFHRGDYAETLARTTPLEARFAAIQGASRERVTARIYQGASLAMMGDFAALASHRARLIADAEARGDRFALVNALSGVFSLASLAADEPARARRELARARALWGDTAVTVQHFFGWLAEARVDLYEGEVEQAIERTERQRPSLERALLLRMPFVHVHLEDLRARAELMRPRPDVRRVRVALRALRRERAGWIDALADALEAALAAHEGRASEQVALEARAAEGFARHGMKAHLVALGRPLEAAIGDVPRLRRALGVVRG